MENNLSLAEIMQVISHYYVHNSFAQGSMSNSLGLNTVRAPQKDQSNFMNLEVHDSISSAHAYVNTTTQNS